MENFVPGTRIFFWFITMMACFSSDTVTTCRSRIKSCIVDEIVEVSEK